MEKPSNGIGETFCRETAEAGLTSAVVVLLVQARRSGIKTEEGRLQIVLVLDQASPLAGGTGTERGLSEPMRQRTTALT